MVLKREAAVVAAAMILAVVGFAYYLTRPTTLTLAVAPRGGTEPALLKAFAEALEARDESIRLQLVPFDGVRESAQALQSGAVDVAVVRPDMALPENGLTLAILREQAVLVAAPESAGIRTLSDLAGKHLGTIAERASDEAVIKAVLANEDLILGSDSVETGGGRRVALMPVEEGHLAGALAARRIDALVLLTTPTSPAAKRILGIVREASEDRRVSLIGVPDGAAIVKRMPKLQAVTVQAGLFGGNPRLPQEDIATVGTSYRLMARASLSRSLAAEVTEDLFETRSRLAETQPAANAIEAPAYETTANATSARLPNHPGAIDYLEREQESFIERYETWIYLLAFLGGGIGSALAWLRQRLTRIRRERIEIATKRLLEIRRAARRTTDAGKLHSIAGEIDDLAANIARHALNRPAEASTMSAAAIAIDAARSTVARITAAVATEQGATAEPERG